MLISLLAVLLSSIFAFLGGIHFYWGMGGNWGKADAIPTTQAGESAMSPGIVATFVVGFGLLAMGGVVAIKAGLLALGLPTWVPNVGIWVIAAIFCLRAIGDFNYVGFFKKVRDTAFGRKDSRYYAPLCLLIAVMAALIGFLG
jgi:Protein of unknown function (DUF3995)